MMDWKIVAFIGLLLTAQGFATDPDSWFQECDRTVDMQIGYSQMISSDGFPEYGYYPGSACRYTIRAPGEYRIKAVCNVNMVEDTYCTPERFYVSESGNPDVEYAEYYCGNDLVNASSDYNEMTIAYISSKYSGQWNCTLTTFCDCGWGKTEKIVGGTVTGKTEFTPMAVLRNPDNEKLYCGGTIISSQWILTAAHCLSLYNILQMQVGVGVWNTSEVGTFTKFYNVSDYKIYPSYVKGKDYFDVALVKVNQRIQFNLAVGPACLPLFYPQFQFNGFAVVATGYGTTSFGGEFSQFLRKVNLNVIPNTQCNSMYNGSKIIADSQVCTYKGVGYDACQYDSGGPIWWRSQDTRLFNVGVISLGGGCGSSLPGINTRTTSFMSWIESVTGPLCRLALQ